MNILVTDGNTRPALAITRSLGRKRHRIFIGAKTKPSLASSSRYCYESFIYPDPSEDTDRFLDHLIQTIIEYDIDMILPVTDITTLSITSNRNEIEQFCDLPFADFETIALLSNKYNVLKLAKELDIPVPDTTFLPDKTHINKLPEKLTFPVVIKPANSRININNRWISTAVSYADNPEELNDILKNKSEMEFPLILQERINGPGIGIFVYYKKGKCIAHFCHKRLREKPPSGGVSVLCESIPINNMAKQYTEKLLSKVKWHGVAMVEFKLDQRDNIPKLMEVNSRFWGSLQLAISSGVDFPSIVVDSTIKEKDIQVFDYKISVKNRWLWGDLDRLLMLFFKDREALKLPPGHKGKLMSLLSFINVFSRRVNHEVLSLDDIKPIICETLQRMKISRSRDKVSQRTEGLFHVHSSYSYDGKSSLSELVVFCEERDYSFIMLTEHAEDFSESKMRSYVEECERLSSDKVFMIPGLEFGFGEYPDLHLLGVGIKEYIHQADISAVIDGIHSQDGLAIIAHPSRNKHYVPMKIADKIDGLEMWNAAYDSRFLPNCKSIKLYKKLKKKNSSLIAISGLDMHTIKDFRELTLSVDGVHTSHKELLNQLRKGCFINRGKIVKFRSVLKIGILSQSAIIIGRLFLNLADYIYWTVYKFKKASQ